jgi:hypothetical protein
VHAFDGNTFIKTHQTDAQGQATFVLPDGSYRFRADKNGWEFWSGADDHCTIAGCTSVVMTIRNSVVVTVLDTAGNPDVGIGVWAYTGSTYANVGATTNAQGQAVLMLPAGSYHFRTSKDYSDFWSEADDHCTVPNSCTSASITTNVPVTVTVTNLDGQPEAGIYVHAFDGNTFIKTHQTNAQGQATFVLPDGSYRFRADKNGWEFWSGADDHCAIAGCTSVAMIIRNSVVVTVLDTAGNPDVGIEVWAYTGSTYANVGATTNVQGQAVLMLPAGTYHFRTSKDNSDFWSGADDHCTVPNSCTSASITTNVPVTVTVTVLDLDGQPAAGLPVAVFTGSTWTGRTGTTNASGQASFTLPPGDYRFRATKGVHEFWSGESNHCTVPGCTAAGITVNNSVVVTVLDTNNQPVVGVEVKGFIDSTFMGSWAVTNAQGQATLDLPAGSFRFKLIKDGATFWSGTTNHCTVPGCTSASITTTLPVTVTVLDLDGQPAAGLPVAVFSGSTWTGRTGTTNASGQVTFTLPPGDYRFRATKGVHEFWSGASNHCTVPGCTSASITVNNTVVVTVLDTNNQPVVGVEVKGFVDSTFMGSWAVTNAQGQATLDMPAGSFRFKLIKDGATFWSGTTNHCTVPGCTSASITTTLPVTVTVLDLDGQPAAGIPVYVFDGTTFTGRSGTTNASGQVTFTLPAGNYRFRADKGIHEFWSGASNHCTVPGCTSASITVNNTVVVTVLDTNNQPVVGVEVKGFVDSTFMGSWAVTNAQGQATLDMPAGSFRFKLIKDGATFWSGTTNHCTVPGCTSASITTTLPVTVTVLDLDGQPAAGLPVAVFTGSTWTGRSGTTNASGQVTFTLPLGDYRFRATKGVHEFWSGESNHCTVPGCIAAGITVNNSVVVTVLDTNGDPQVGVEVKSYNGTTFTGSWGTTNAQGQATLDMPAGTFRFRAVKDGTEFWSGTENHCSVPGCTEEEIIIRDAVIVTVLDAYGIPEAGLEVQAYDGDTFMDVSGTTNAQGQVTLWLLAGDYRFKAVKNETSYWSSGENHCEIPGCTDASIAIDGGLLLSKNPSKGDPWVIPCRMEYFFSRPIISTM